MDPNGSPKKVSFVPVARIITENKFNWVDQPISELLANSFQVIY
jgi:hypothetical protein